MTPLPDTGYPDWQTARDFLSGLVGNQVVATGGASGPSGTFTIATIAIGTTLVIRTLLLTIGMGAAGVGAMCSMNTQITISRGFAGSGAAANLHVAGWVLADNTADNVVVTVPGPISIHAVGLPNLVQITIAAAPAGFFFWSAEATIYGVVI